jgi:hypothetical protein
MTMVVLATTAALTLWQFKLGYSRPFCHLTPQNENKRMDTPSENGTLATTMNQWIVQ